MTTPFVKFPGSNLGWVDCGTARRRGTNALYEAYGSPGVVTVPITDFFWRLPAVLGDNWGELYRRPGQTALWLLHSESGVTVRKWAPAQDWTNRGEPPVVELPTTNPFWTLPSYGTTPPEGA